MNQTENVYLKNELIGQNYYCEETKKYRHKWWDSKTQKFDDWSWKGKIKEKGIAVKKIMKKPISIKI